MRKLASSGPAREGKFIFNYSAWWEGGDEAESAAQPLTRGEETQGDVEDGWKFNENAEAKTSNAVKPGHARFISIVNKISRQFTSHSGGEKKSEEESAMSTLFAFASIRPSGNLISSPSLPIFWLFRLR